MNNTKKIIAALAILGSSITFQAQTYQTPDKTNTKTGMSETTYKETPVPDNTVPDKVKSAFYDGYSRTAKPTWKKEGDNYKACLKNGSLGSTAVYDKNGTLLYSERELRANEYPSEISTYFTKNGNDKDMKVWESNRNGVIKYFVKDKPSGQITWFDKDGNHIMGSQHMAHHDTK